MHYIKSQRLRKITSAILVVVATTIAILGNVNGVVALGIILCVCFISVAIIKADYRDTRREIERAKRNDERRHQDIEQRWYKEAGGQRFQAKLRELEAKKQEYQSLGDVKQRRLRQLQQQSRDRQLYRYLDSFRIDRANINGIGPSRKANLQSFGIETAADVTERAVLDVPGFGPSYTRKLLYWRRAIESRFVFNPAKGIDPADIQALERELTGIRLALEQVLNNGPSLLRQISNHVKATREVIRPALEDSIQKLAQAEADWKAVSSLTSSLTPVFIALGITLVVLLPIKASLESNILGLHNTNAAQTKGATSVTLPIQSQDNNTSSLSSNEQRTIESKKQFEQGVIHTKSGKYEEAIKHYQQAISLKEDFTEAYHELGYAYYKLNKYEDAVAASKQAIALNPKNADTHHNLGLAYGSLGQWQEAIKAFQQAIAIKSNYAVAYYDLGVAYKKVLEDESAIAAFQEAIRLKEDFAAAHYQLGLLYNDNNNETAAMGEYTYLLSQNKKLADLLFQYIQKSP